MTTCDLFQLVCSPWSQAVVLSHGETWLHHLGKVYFTLTRCFSSYISCSISLTGVTFAKCISSSVTSTTCTVAKHPVAQDLPCKQELEGELWLPARSCSDSKNILNILCRWEDAAYSPREKLEVIHSNQRGKSSYNYFSFFVCRNPVVEIRFPHQYVHYWLQVSKLSSIYRYNLKRSVKVHYPPHVCLRFLQKVNIFGQNYPGPTSTRNIKWVAAIFPSVSSTLSLRCRAIWDIVSSYFDLSNDCNTFSLKGNISINLDTTLANCHPCSHRWDAVVHMETFDKDSQAILRSENWVIFLRVNMLLGLE